MKIIDDKKIKIDNVEYDLLFTFESEDTGRKYFAYTDQKIQENGRKNINVVAYDVLFNKFVDMSKDELDMVNDVLLEIEGEARL